MDSFLPEEFRLELLNAVQAGDENTLFESHSSKTGPENSDKSISPSHWLDGDLYIFLEKFQSKLTTEQLEKIRNSVSEGEAKWYASFIIDKRNNLQEISTFPHSKSHSYIKNRRLTYLNRVLEAEGYFTLNSIQKRDPVLFAEFFGDKKDPVDHSFAAFEPSVSLVERIYYDYDMGQAHDLAKRQRDVEDDAWEEDSETGDIADDSDVEDSHALGDECPPELIRIMKDKFMDGREEGFDYSTVDNNEEYDDPILINQQCEEDYFNSEDPTETTDTGILDY